jgi:hypothetical protein
MLQKEETHGSQLNYANAYLYEILDNSISWNMLVDWKFLGLHCDGKDTMWKHNWFTVPFPRLPSPLVTSTYPFYPM